jgi:hypothetical protein
MDENLAMLMAVAVGLIGLFGFALAGVLRGRARADREWAEIQSTLANPAKAANIDGETWPEARRPRAPRRA